MGLLILERLTVDNMSAGTILPFELICDPWQHIFYEALPKQLVQQSQSNDTLSDSIAKTQSVTEAYRAALKADAQDPPVQDFNIWIFNLQVHWTLDLQNGGSASGEGNSKASQDGYGAFWGQPPSVASSIVPGAFSLDVSTYNSHLTLYNNIGKLVLDSWFSGYAPNTLLGHYTGNWGASS